MQKGAQAARKLWYELDLSLTIIMKIYDNSWKSLPSFIVQIQIQLITHL